MVLLVMCFPLTPLTAIRTLLNSENRNLVLTKLMTSGYCSPRFSAIILAIDLTVLVQEGPMPPVVKKIKGTNDPFSLSRTLSR